jgi:alkylated DNA nucleotide flippase Atl1
MKTRTSWRQKLERKHPSHGKVIEIPPKMQKRFGKGTMLIPKPLDVDSLIRQVPKGKLVTQAQLREKLAKDSKADSTCPITTGIFVRIVAETAEEDAKKGRKDITPWWRVVKPDGGLNERFPGSWQEQEARLKQEGHTTYTPKGKKIPKVMDFKKYLHQL